MNQNISDILNTAGVAAIIVALVGTIGGLLERTHRRTQHTPCTSSNLFGADLAHDRDLVRTLEELRAVPAEPAQSAGRETGPEASGRAALAARPVHPAGHSSRRTRPVS